MAGFQNSCKIARSFVLFRLEPISVIHPVSKAAAPRSKDVVRDVIFKHIGEVKHCYELELEKNQDLAGRVMVNFTISADGKVTESKIDKTTLRNETVEKCIVEAVRTWEFPKPKGGIVTVTYPFLLAASGEDADKAKAASKK